MQTVLSLFAFCGADGVVYFGPTVPRGSLPVVAKCPDVARADEWTDLVRGLCRRGYGGYPLVPGVPEASDQEAGLEALERFRDLVQPVVDKEFK